MKGNYFENYFVLIEIVVCLKNERGKKYTNNTKE